MKIIIEDKKASEIYYNGVYYKTRVPIEVSFSDALRLKRTYSVSFVDVEVLPYDPSLYSDNREVALVADIDTVSGWGNVGLNLIKYSSKYVNTSLIGRLNNVSDSHVLNALSKDINPRSAVVIHEQPKEEWFDLPFEKKIAVVPFETTRIPPSWVPRINSCTALIVPCYQNVQMMKDSGVTIPIEVVHWGIDANKFTKIDRPPRKTFTFGIMGSLSKRKGIDILVDAFFKAFPKEQDVRLLCRTSASFFIWAVKDKRMKIEMTPVSHEELMGTFFKEIDILVYPTRGEGFGLCMLEAMATGVPVIATGWSGPVDFINEDNGWLIDYKLVPAVDFENNVYHEPCGDWAEPSVDNLITLMRYAYEHQDEVKAKGLNAYNDVQREWLWDNKIKMYIDVLNKYL